MAGLESYLETTPAEAFNDAVYHGDVKRINELLLGHGDAINVDALGDSGLSALHQAAAAGQPAVVALLAKLGATIGLPDATGWTALHHAAAGNHTTAARALVDAGADPGAAARDGSTPLYVALLRGSVGAAEYLVVDAKCPVDAAFVLDVHGRRTLAHFSAAAGALRVLQELLQRDEALSVVADATGQHPLHYAAATSSHGFLGFAKGVEALLKAGADPCAHDEAQATPLHVAAKHGHAAVVALLLEAGSRADAEDATGATPLALAKQGQCRRLLEGEPADQVLRRGGARSPDKARTKKAQAATSPAARPAPAPAPEQPSSPVPPRDDQPVVWMPDSEAKSCCACSKGFGLLRRKHHCRRCGKIYCDPCAPVRQIEGRNETRVCDVCFVARGGSVRSKKK